MTEYADMARTACARYAADGGINISATCEKINKEMSVSDAHELMRAAEVLNLLDLGEALMIAARERKESRDVIYGPTSPSRTLCSATVPSRLAGRRTPRTAWRDRLK
ncbi:MAG: hypothetical protein ACLRWP_07185 [Bilophila wadsworthia]